MKNEIFNKKEMENTFKWTVNKFEVVKLFLHLHQSENEVCNSRISDRDHSHGQRFAALMISNEICSLVRGI